MVADRLGGNHRAEGVVRFRNLEIRGWFVNELQEHAAVGSRPCVAGPSSAGIWVQTRPWSPSSAGRGTLSATSEVSPPWFGKAAGMPETRCSRRRPPAAANRRARPEGRQRLRPAPPPLLLGCRPARPLPVWPAAWASSTSGWSNGWIPSAAPVTATANSARNISPANAGRPSISMITTGCPASASAATACR